ncbi:MAG: hydrogenase maturation nickel metallochaperone HypA [Actinomycetota bacterium]|nr:hydrogenase maturation nickel metallochaperone HypA [Actinomycetota bacterium]MDI6821863.1 hydrogenase maturation nickel metallochaperone HypA [Actinomycetota bacterium]
MHELGITENILSIALEQAQQRDAKKILKIRLKIGEMTAVVDECIRFYFEILSKDTMAEGAEIEVENVPIKVKCPRCGKIREANDYNFICPQCEVLSTEIVSGRELYVSSIEIE